MKTEFENSITQLENSKEKLKVECINQVLKRGELDHTTKQCEKIKITGKDYVGTLRYHQKTSLWIIGIVDREDFQVNSIDYIFSKIIDENLSKLRGMHSYRYREHLEHQIGKTRKEIPHVLHS